MKRLSIFLSLFFLGLISVSLSSAIILNNGTSLGASNVGIQITFQGITPVYADSATQYSNAIVMSNPSYINNGYTFNLTSLNQSAPNYVLDSGAFPYVGYDDLSLIKIYSNVSNSINGSISGINVSSCNLIGIIKYVSALGDYSENVPYSSINCSLNQMSISLRNIENSSNSGPNLIQISYVTPSGGGGASITAGSPNLATPNQTDLYLCNQTFNYIQNYTIGDFTHIFDLQAQMQANNHTYDSTTIENYIINWQNFCSDALNQTLNQEYVCKTIYYSISQQNSSNSVDYGAIQAQINQVVHISLNLLQYYVNNYNSACFPQTQQPLPIFKAKTLPFTITSIFPGANCTEVSNIFGWQIKNCIPALNGFFNLFKGQTQACSPNINFSIIGFNMDSSVPFWAVNLGKSSCGQISSLRWWFNLGSNDAGYAITGLKSWFLLILFAGFLFIMTIRLRIRTAEMTHIAQEQFGVIQKLRMPHISMPSMHLPSFSSGRAEPVSYKPIYPFKNARQQRIISTIVFLVSFILMVFNMFNIANINIHFPGFILGYLFALISLYYLFKSI